MASMHSNGSYAGVRTMPHYEVEDQVEGLVLHGARTVAINADRPSVQIAATEERKMPRLYENGRATE